MTNHNNGANLTEKELRLIEELRKVAFGQVVIYMQDGEPLRIERIKESFKL